MPRKVQVGSICRQWKSRQFGKHRKQAKNVTLAKVKWKLPAETKPWVVVPTVQPGWSSYVWSMTEGCYKKNESPFLYVPLSRIVHQPRQAPFYFCRGCVWLQHTLVSGLLLWQISSKAKGPNYLWVKSCISTATGHYNQPWSLVGFLWYFWQLICSIACHLFLNELPILLQKSTQSDPLCNRLSTDRTGQHGMGDSPSCVHRLKAMAIEPLFPGQLQEADITGWWCLTMFKTLEDLIAVALQSGQHSQAANISR